MSSSGAQQFQLANGMQLIVQPDRRAPTAMHMVWVRVGSMDEVDGTSGVAHVLEHMMFKGTKTVPPGDFSRRVAALGGQENAFTSRDYTGYYQQIPSHRLEEVMRLEADRFAHNQWPDAEFRKEIEVVKEERRMRTEDQPRALLWEQLGAAAFVASPYRRPVVGWMSDLDAMTPDDVRQFHHRWYVPGNATVVVAGDVDVAKVRALAEKIYGSIPARAVPERKPRTEPAQRGPGVRVDTHVYPGYTIPSYYDSLMAKLIVAGRVGPGGGRESVIRRMARALDEFVVEGVKTTIPFHRDVMANEAFLRGDVKADFIEKHLALQPVH